MMDITKDIQPLTNFKRNTTELLRQMKETGEPIVLTINGRAELVVQDREVVPEAPRARRPPGGDRRGPEGA